MCQSDSFFLLNIYTKNLFFAKHQGECQSTKSIFETRLLFLMFFFSAGDELSVYLDAKECYYCFNNNYENKTKKKG